MRQLTKSDLKQMTPEQVAKALLEGKCNRLLGAPVPFDPDAPRLPDKDTGTPSEWKAALAKITDEQLEEATASGQIPDWLLTDPEPEPATNIDQGARGKQRDKPWDGMTSAEIAAATKRGDFDLYLKGEVPVK